MSRLRAKYFPFITLYLCVSVSFKGRPAHHPFLHEEKVVQEAGGTRPCVSKQHG